MHGLGYRNYNIEEAQVFKLLSGLEKFKGQLKSFQIDMGRWGCEQFSSYKYITDATLKKMGEILKD